MANILAEQYANSHIIWFWGILAESTISKGQREFHVYVPDLTPFRNGDVSEKGSTNSSDLFNVMTQSRESVDTHLSKTIVAEYLGFESSRQVPDMYKGQQVLVMTYGCTDRWFWIPLERDDYIKTFEHIRWSCADIAMIHKIPGVPDEDTYRKVNLHDDNTYFLEIDTKYKKHVLISTAGTDGEKYRYFFKIDAKEHTVEIWDGLVNKADMLFGKVLPLPRNTIKLESDPILKTNAQKGAETASGTNSNTGQMLNGRITLQTAAGATLMLEDVDIKIVAPRDLSIAVGRNMITRVQNDKATTVMNDVHVKIFGNFTKWVKGFINKHVVGLYTYLYENDVQRDIRKNYTRDVTLAVTEHAQQQTVNIDVNYVVTANNQLNMTGVNQAMFFSNTSTIISSDKKLAFVAKKIVTTNHIYGCCGCPGH